MKFCKIIIMVVCIFISVFLCSCNNSNIEIDEEQSFFSKFEIKDDEVYIYCNVLVKNSFSKEKQIMLKGVFEEDAQNGLLTTPELQGYSVGNNSKIFKLNTGENWIEVVFIGEHAGNNQKCNRLLPEIKLVEIDG